MAVKETPKKPAPKKLVEIPISSAEAQVLGTLAQQRFQAEQGVIRVCDDIAVSRGKDLKKDGQSIKWVVDTDKITAFEKGE